jgi:hypothetical protein
MLPPSTTREQTFILTVDIAEFFPLGAPRFTRVQADAKAAWLP